VLCERVVIADTPLPRMRGLLGRRSLSPGDGVMLQGAPSIHTAFMRFDFDVVFLDASLRVLKAIPRLKPWRAVTVRRATHVLELAAGEVSRRGVEVGDQIVVADRDLAARVADPVAAVEDVLGERAAAASNAGEVKVLLVGADRRFRSVASTLLRRRGYTVIVVEQVASLADVAAREHVDVVVLDTGALPAVAAFEAARLEALSPSVAMVLVSDDLTRAMPAPPVLPKWGSFDGLYDAIEGTRAMRSPAVS
jgi:uncharacterized membrane protein (UPF0127 family)